LLLVDQTLSVVIPYSRYFPKEFEKELLEDFLVIFCLWSKKVVDMPFSKEFH
jgi:hypothetical protein